MKTNFPEQAKSLSPEALMVDFNEKLEYWRTIFPTGFSDAFESLITTLPEKEYGHFLLGQASAQGKGTFFFEEMQAFNSLWSLLFSDVLKNISQSRRREADGEKVTYHKDQSKMFRELGFLKKVFPGASILDKVEKLLESDGKKFTEDEVKSLTGDLHRCFSISQAVICQNWRNLYNLKNSATESADEQWKNELWQKFNNPYVLQQITYFLSRKILAISDFKKTSNLSTWPDVINHYLDYFSGFDKDVYQPLLNNWLELRQGGKIALGMAVNPYAWSFEGRHLDALIKRLKEMASQGEVFNLHQAELANYFSDMIIKYPPNITPTLDLKVSNFVRDYNVQETFNYKAPV